MALGLAAAASASVLVLTNGDRITGCVIRRADGKVWFKSDLLGTIVAREGSFTIVETPAPGAAPSTTTTSTTKATNATVTTTTVTTTVAAQKPAGSRRSTAVAVLPPSHWVGKVEFGYDNALANDIRTVALDFRAEVERTKRKENYLLKTDFLYGSTGLDTTTDQGAADFRWRHSLSDRLFTQMDTSYLTDRVKLIHYQIEQTGGLGYRVFQTPRQTVSIGTGVTGEQLDATGVEKGFTYLGNVFQDYVYKLNGRYTLREDSSADYSPESRGLSGIVPDTVTSATGSQRDYAYKFHTTIESKINSHLSLNLHFEYNYDNAVVVPSARAEQRVTTTLGYGF